jgi:hypothetical protein
MGSNAEQYHTLKNLGVKSSEAKRRVVDKRPSLNISPLDTSSRANRSRADESMAANATDQPQNSSVLSALSNKPANNNDSQIAHTYETDIIKNIQSIRRKSIEHMHNSAENVFDSSLNATSSSQQKVVKESSRLPSQSSAESQSHHAPPPLTHQVSSIVKKSSSESSQDGSSPLQAKSSYLNESLNKSNKTPLAKKKSASTEDDDDAVFSPKSAEKPAGTPVNTSHNRSQNEVINKNASHFDEDAPIKSKYISEVKEPALNRSNLSAGESKTNLQNKSGNHRDDEDMFKYDHDKKSDDEEEEEEEGTGAALTNRDSEGDDVDDDSEDESEQMLKTNVFTKNQLSTMRAPSKNDHHDRQARGSLGSVSEMSKSEATPRVTPRKSLRRQVQKDSESDYDDDDKF